MQGWRWIAGSTLLLCAWASLVPLAASQAPGGPGASFVFDAPGDVRVVGPATNDSDDGQYPQADVLAAWIGNETEASLEFGVGLAALPSDLPVTALNEAGFVWHFKIGQAELRVGQGADMQSCGGGVGVERPNGAWCGSFDVQYDATTNSIKVTVPREYLVNETDYPFGPGLAITDLYATTAYPVAGVPTFVIPSPGTYARDRAPDDGFAARYESQLSNTTSQGGLALTPLEPVRTSNGESTTLVYPMTLSNQATTETTALLELENAETNFDIRIPSRLLVPAQGSVTFPVILSMGFEHRHGELATFLVRAEDAADPGRWSESRLGVYWLATPQPAGHHDTMWLHSGEEDTDTILFFFIPYQCTHRTTWINPLEADDGATEEDVPACPPYPFSTTPQAPPEHFVDWEFPLQPDLAIGLDFDVTRVVDFGVDVKTPVPAQGELVAEILYCDPSKQEPVRFFRNLDCPGSWVTLAEGTSGMTSLAAGGQTRFQYELPMKPEADYLPYQRHAALALYLRLVTDRPLTPPTLGGPDVSPLVVPKTALLTLPLVEYHDPIDQAFENVGSLVLRPLGPFEKFANPGQSLRFPFELTNVNEAPQEITLAIEGHNPEWARVEGPTELTLPPKTPTTVNLLVEVPVDAAEGERSELFLVAESREDPNVVAIARLRATTVDVTTRVIAPETVSADTDEQETPSAPLAFVGLALVFGAAVLRRRGT